MKIKDHEKCPCGSGKNFNQCCKPKVLTGKNPFDSELLSNPNRLNQLIFEQFKKTDFKICMHPEKDKCKMPIKNAHTLQNNGVLSLLAENGHVMVTNLLNKQREGTSIQKSSKNNATTFYGFCEYHDSKVFEDIERKPYANEVKQNFLYAYRACAQEYHKKHRTLTSLQNIIKLNPIILNFDPFVDSMANQQLSLNDVRETLEIFNNAFIGNDFDILENYVLKFDQTYDFAVTTTFNPTFDLNGNMINDIYSTDPERLKCVFITFLPTTDKSYFILSCLKQDYMQLCTYFNQVKKLTEDQLKTFLNNILPTFSENIVLSPRLWSRWTPFSQREYEKVVTGEVGDFSKLLSNQSPFDSFEDFIQGMNIKNGVIDVTQKAKYDLFKK